MKDGLFWFLFLIAKKFLTKRVDLGLRLIGKTLIWIYKIFNGVSVAPKRLLIVKPDGLGDFFIAFRYIQDLAISDRYKDFEIDLLTADYTIPFAKELLGTNVTNFWCVRRSFFYQRVELISNWGLYSALFAIVCLSQFRRRRYSNVLYMAFHHEPYIDYLTHALNPTERVFLNEADVLPKVFSKKSQIEFFEPLKIRRAMIKLFPEIPFDFSKSNDRLKPLNNIILALGASKQSRIFFPESYAKVLNHFTNKYSFSISVIISETELNLYNRFISAYLKPETVLLSDPNNPASTIRLINSAVLVIGNDSGMIHLAAVNSIPYICIASGNHLFRFSPYPEDWAPNSITLYPPDIMASIVNDCENLYHTSKQFYDKDVNEIPVDMVINLIEPIFKNAFQAI